MSSNIQNTTQNAAVGAGSDTDSVSSLASRTADMNLGSSSSPVPVSTQDSDEEGDLTVVKDTAIAEMGESEEGQIPFLDNFGEPVNEDTPPEDFTSWPAYLVYCKQGPKLKIRLAVVNDQGEGVGFCKVDYSKKLLVDHGEYFAGLYRTGETYGMTEFQVGYLSLEDLNVVDFERLVMVISSGHPDSRHNIGPSWNTLSDLLDCSVLCDRFAMPEIGGWVKKRMDDYIHEMGEWAQLYHREVIARPGAGLEQVHKDRVRDVYEAYERSSGYPAEKLPVQCHRYVKFLISSCPRVLLESMIDDFPTEMVYALAKEMLVPTA
ncbi:hypothetical protein diail_7041 [Diaporthe ilicicola]|nr:hypothetical protein diail_7041 [Diaporthe ilicicola]